MKVLITGGLGFIGSHLVLQIMEEYPNADILIMNRITQPSSLKNYDYLRERLQNRMPRVFLGDLVDKQWTNSIIHQNKPDVIIHLAAMAGVRHSTLNGDGFIDANVKGTLHILEAVRDTVMHPCKVIVASSSTVHSHPVRSIYALTKKMTEEMCDLFHELYKINIICLRFFSVYGERCRSDLLVGKILQCIQNPVDYPYLQIYGNGDDVSRDFTYIDDTVTGIFRAIGFKKQGSFHFDIGTGKPYSINQVIEIVQPHLPSTLKIDRISGYKEDQKMSKAQVLETMKHLQFKSIFQLTDVLPTLVNMKKK